MGLLRWLRPTSMVLSDSADQDPRESVASDRPLQFRDYLFDVAPLRFGAVRFLALAFRSVFSLRILPTVFSELILCRFSSLTVLFLKIQTTSTRKLSNTGIAHMTMKLLICSAFPPLNRCAVALGALQATTAF